MPARVGRPALWSPHLTSSRFFLKALFTGQLYKDPATLDLMKQHTKAGVDKLAEGTIYAHGMFSNNGVLGHGGQTLGFESDGGYIPDQDVTLVIWSNAGNSNVQRTIVPGIAAVVVEADQAEHTDQTGQAALPRFEPLDECFAEPPADLPVDLDMDCRIETFSLPAILSIMTEGGADQVAELLGPARLRNLLPAAVPPRDPSPC